MIIFDTDSKITMLMKAIQARRILFCHYLMDIQQIALDVEDKDGRNVLDYIYLAADRVNDRKYKKQIKVDLEEYDSILLRIYDVIPGLKDKNGRNILLSACYMGDMLCVQKLIEKDQNIVASVDNDGSNAWTIASMTDQHQIMKYLHDNYGISGIKRIKPLDGDNYKVLTLGPGSSGKSTIHNQIRDIYSQSLFENRGYDGLPYLRQNTVQGMLKLLRKIQQMSDEIEEYQHYKADFEDDEKVYDAVKMVVNFGHENFHDNMNYNGEEQELTKAIEILWNMDTVKKVYYDRGSNENGYQFAEQNLDYLFENVKEKFSQEYEVTKEDILKTYIRTTGIIQQEIEENGVGFTIFDVGGQRNERKKWIHIFDAVDRLVYVISLSSIFEVLVEDEKVNGMTESIKLWKDIVNGKWFKFTKMYLIFNKDDCYRAWLKKQCEDGRSGAVADLLQKILAVDEPMDIGFAYQDYFNSKDTLLSHGYIHDIENEINKEKEVNTEMRYLSDDVMQLIDLYLDVYFEGLYDKSIEYITTAFLKCDKSGLREIEVNTLNALDDVDVKRVFSKLFK